MPRQRKVAEIVGRNPEYTKQFVASGRREGAPPMAAKAGAQGREDKRVEDARREAPDVEEVREEAEEVVAPEERAATVLEATARSSSPRAARQMVNVVAYPKKEHEPALLRLEGEGFPTADVLKLAGKRASKRFVPDARFVPMADVQRMPRSRAFYTSKRIPVDLLDTLRLGHDPLGLKSADTLLRGQFEPIFWTEIEGLIEELSKQG